MNTAYALIKREWLEHMRAFFWATVPILALVIIFGITFAPGPADINIDIRSSIEAQEFSIEGEDGETPSVFAIVTAILLDTAGSSDAELNRWISTAMKYLATPFYWVFLIVSLFALVGSLYDDRKDRSVLFWKSMPVSDTATVLSKYAFVAWVAPLAVLLVMLATQVFAVGLIAYHVEDGMGGRVWANAGLLTGFAQTAFGFLLNGIVMLPIFGWMLLISSWAKSIPLIWALSIPFWLAIFEWIILDTGFVSKIVRFHGDMPTLPRGSFDGDFGLSATTVSDQLAVFAEPQLWVGVVLGVAFIAGAIYLRGKKAAI